MKKIISVLLGFLLCMTQTVPVQAQETEITLDDVLTAATNIANIYLDIGFDTEQLLTIMAIMPKDEPVVAYDASESFNLAHYLKENPVYLFNPADFDLPDISLYAGDYSGNPPQSEADQKSRMIYLKGVLEREYSDAKYDKGTYMSYLYASHYLENAIYDPANTDAQNFGGIYAHIIGFEDIRNFDNFYTIGRNAAIASSFKSFGSMVSTVLKDKAATVVASQALSAYRESAETDAAHLLQLLNDTGIYGDEFIGSTLKNLGNALILAVNEDSDATTEALIESIYGQLSNDITYSVCSFYVESIKRAASDLVIVSLISPVLSGIIFYASTLCNLITPASLGALYYTWHGRQTERQLIAYGIRPRP